LGLALRLIQKGRVEAAALHRGAPDQNALAEKLNALTVALAQRVEFYSLKAYTAVAW